MCGDVDGDDDTCDEEDDEDDDDSDDEDDDHDDDNDDDDDGDDGDHEHGRHQIFIVMRTRQVLCYLPGGKRYQVDYPPKATARCSGYLML